MFYCDYCINGAGLPSVSVTLAKDKNSATFTATVDGVGKEKFSYKWKHDDEEVSEETETLNIASPNKDDNGEYVCIVSNEYGDFAESAPVTLTVTSKFDAML